MTSRSSTAIFMPRPSQSGHAPYGALKENSLGSISDMVKPHIGQEKCSEKCMSSPSMTLTVMFPSPFSSAVCIESLKRASMPSRMASRSTTTSTSCFLFFESSGTDSMSYISPSTMTRAYPSLAKSSNIFSCNPLRPFMTGAKSCTLVLSGSSMTRSTIS